MLGTLLGDGHGAACPVLCMLTMLAFRFMRQSMSVQRTHSGELVRCAAHRSDNSRDAITKLNCLACNYMNTQAIFLLTKP